MYIIRNKIQNVSPFVEDEIVLWISVEQFLRQHGFTVVTAVSDEEALEKFTGADVIVLDIMLPEVSGIEVFIKFARLATCRC